MTVAFIQKMSYRLFSKIDKGSGQVTTPHTSVKRLALAGFLMAMSLPSYAACNPPKTFFKHLSCTASSQYFLASADSGRPVALVDRKGKKIADLMRYTQVDANSISNGLMPIQKDRKVGYINLKGREIISPNYDLMLGDRLTSGWARPAKDNRIIVQKGGRIGIINTSGKVILPFSAKYTTISDYDNGLAQVFKGRDQFWIDKSARKTADPNAPIQSASEPISTLPKTQKSSSRVPTPATQPQPVFNPSYPIEIWKSANRNGKWGFVDTNNVPMITFSFDAVEPFSEGLAGVRVADKWGFVDLKGDLVIPFRFDEASVIRHNGPNYEASYYGKPPFNFVNGKAWVGNLKDDSKLCIDGLVTYVDCYEQGETAQTKSGIITPVELPVATKIPVVSTVQTVLEPITEPVTIFDSLDIPKAVDVDTSVHIYQTQNKSTVQTPAPAINMFTNTAINDESSSNAPIPEPLEESSMTEDPFETIEDFFIE